MYKLHLTPLQEGLRDAVRDFVEREIKPVILHPDHLQDIRKPLPLALLDQASQMGLRSLVASEAMYTATDEAAEYFGAMGVMLDMPLAKEVQEARVFLHSGDSNSVAKLRIAEAVAGFERGAPYNFLRH